MTTTSEDGWHKLIDEGFRVMFFMPDQPAAGCGPTGMGQFEDFLPKPILAGRFFAAEVVRKGMTPHMMMMDVCVVHGN